MSGFLFCSRKSSSSLTSLNFLFGPSSTLLYLTYIPIIILFWPTFFPFKLILLILFLVQGKSGPCTPKKHFPFREFKLLSRIFRISNSNVFWSFSIELNFLDKFSKVSSHWEASRIQPFALTASLRIWAKKVQEDILSGEEDFWTGIFWQFLLDESRFFKGLSLWF